MSKKIIAVLLVATILFMFSFAACNKDKDEEEDETTKLYADVSDYNYVTDENGERVLSPDGEILVYVTDEDGETVTNKAGEPETLAQAFVPILEDNKAEYYGYSIELPEGWTVDETKSGAFINKGKNQRVDITPLNKTYDDYYEGNKKMYESLAKEPGATVTWDENYDLGKDCAKTVRFTLKTETEMSVMYFFVNNDNLYKVLFVSADPTTAIAESEAICAAVSYKPYQYFEIEVTDKADVDESVWESALADGIAEEITSSSAPATTKAGTTVATTVKAQ